MKSKPPTFFTEIEKKSNEKFRRIRTKFFKPLLKKIDKLGLRPGHVTMLSALSVLGFIIFARTNLIVAFIFIVVHLLFDGLDGSLARFQKKTSVKGAYLDIFVDHFVLTVITLTLINYYYIEIAWGLTYIISYLLMIYALLILNRSQNKIIYVLRSKLILYLLVILLPLLGKTEMLNLFAIIFSFYQFTVVLYIMGKMSRIPSQKYS
jgi:phosphatidylglycerophosphate synthase